MADRRSWGSVFKRPETPRWYIRYPSGHLTAAGRPSYIVRAVGTKDEARRVLDTLRSLQLVNELRPPTRPQGSVTQMTLADAIEEYVTATKRAPSTVQAYRRTLRLTTEHGIGELPVGRVDTRAIERFLATFDGAAPATIRGHLTTVSAALSRLVKQDRLDQNPAAQVKRPKLRTKARAVLSRTEVGKLVDACESEPQLRVLVLAGLYTGARCGELLDLRWSDVEFERRVIVIRRKKTGNVGTIRIHPDLEEELRAHRTKLHRVPHAMERVFPPARGGAKRWRMDKLMTAAIQRAGIRRPGMCFHALRNTFATRYLEAGGNARNLQSILGHSQLSTTEIYVRAVDEQAASEVEKLDVGFGSPQRTSCVPPASGRKHARRRKSRA